MADLRELGEQVHVELWVSLAALLRSYTAVHGLNGNRQATIEHDENRILARHKEKWLELKRKVATITWQRENGTWGTLELTQDSRLRGVGMIPAEEEMDMAAEAWARDLMLELPR